MHDLEHPLRSAEVAQLELAEIHEIRCRRETVARERRGGLRDEDLAGMRGGHQARGAVHHRAVVVATPVLRIAGVQTHAHTQRSRRAPRLGLQRQLPGHCRVDGVRRGGKGGVHAVAGGLDDVAVVFEHRALQDLVVPGERVLHRLGMVLPQTSRPLEIREEEGDRSLRQHRHGRPYQANWRQPGGLYAVWLTPV